MGRIAACLALLAGVRAACPYEGLGEDILVADATCGKTIKICGVNSTCDVTNTGINYSIPVYSGWPAIGSMQFYPNNNLTIMDSPQVTIAHMSLPKNLNYLIFQNISKIDLGNTAETQWNSLHTLEFDSCPVVFPNTIKWPLELYTIILKANAMSNIPSNLPPTLTELGIQGNTLQDLVYLPKQLTLLNLDSNLLKTVANEDWTWLTFLRLSNNEKLTSISNIKLSSNLTYFDISNCSALNNITVDASTFAALNNLTLYTGNEDENDDYVGYVVNKAIETDAAACGAIGGTVQSLWKATSKFPVTVCVTAPPKPTAASSSSSTGLIIGIVCGVLVVVGVAVFFVLRHRKKKQSQPAYFQYDLPTHTNGTGGYPTNNGTGGYPTNNGTNGTGTYKIGTNGTGGPTAGTNGSAGSRGALQYADADVLLDVTP
ncbi:hypothetical protein ACHHYP_17400, partial [Achlya hypogyna]